MRSLVLALLVIVGPTIALGCTGSPQIVEVVVTATPVVEATIAARVQETVVAKEAQSTDVTPDRKPKVIETPTASPRPAPTPTFVPTVLPTPTIFPTPDVPATVAAMLAAQLATMQPTPTPTPFPTATPTQYPTRTYTPRPTGTPTLSQLIADVAPAVVQIFTPSGSGSGFVVDHAGWVLTNAHVTKPHGQTVPHGQVTVVFHGDTRVRSEVVGWEEYELVDLALIKVAIPGFASPLEFARTNDVRVGDEVVALGFPLGRTLGVEMSASEGIVSAKRDKGQGIVHIQTSAAVNPGNSGGPLNDSRGQVVGINTYGPSYTSDGRPVDNIAFAVSSGVASRFLPHLMAGYRAGVIDYSVPAGETREMRIMLPKNWELAYEFRTDLDINVALLGPTGTAINIHERQMSGSHSIVASTQGIYTLVFDNMYSLFTSKDVILRYRKSPPD